MSATRAYRSRRRPERTEATRGRILAAVRELLEEGRFHESTVEEVAERAGVARATLYGHFRSRLDLVDGICDTFAVNPALVELREAVGRGAPEQALDETLAAAARFWASEDAVLGELYGAAAIDPAARDLVDRQRADRRGEMGRLARRLHRAGALRPGLGERRATALLMTVSSYETWKELRREGLAGRDAAAALRQSGRALLLGRS